jgi:hypothetical protein
MRPGGPTAFGAAEWRALDVTAHGTHPIVATPEVTKGAAS